MLEKLLVTDTVNFKRFLNSSPPESVTEAERNEKEAYRYSKVYLFFLPIRFEFVLMSVREPDDALSTRLSG